jgi:hypothetical protein
MSKALPVIIGFMASLLGLGGITDKIQNIIKRVRGPIEKAIDWVISQAVKFARKIGNKLGFGKGKKGEEDEKAKDAKLENGPIGETISFKAPDEAHRLWIELVDGKPVVMVASNPTKAALKLKEIASSIRNLPKEQHARAEQLVKKGFELLKETNKKVNTALQELNVDRESGIKAKQELDNRIESIQEDQQLAYIFQELFELIFNNKHLDGKQLDAQGNPLEANVNAEYAVGWYHSELTKAMGGGVPMDRTNSKGNYHEQPASLAAIVDKNDGNRVYFGMSAGEAGMPEEKQTENEYRRQHTHPYLRNRVNEFENEHGGSREAWPVTNCGEYEATNKALEARKNFGGEANYEGLEGLPVEGGKATPTYKPPCKNCRIVHKPIFPVFP